MNTLNPPDDVRFEVKFVVEPAQFSWIEGWVRSHGAGFFESYPVRQVNNIYFDTFDLSTYRENVSGVSLRTKIRFRWYGDTQHAEAGTLELKRRVRNLGWKDTYRTGPVEMVDLDWSAVRRDIRSRLPREGQLWLDEHPLPVLINRYRRRYFESADRRIRLTIDWKQRVYDQRIASTPNFSRAANLPDTMVVEFKFLAEDRPAASDALQTFPIRVSRNSKYVIGVEAIQDV